MSIVDIVKNFRKNRFGQLASLFFIFIVTVIAYFDKIAGFVSNASSFIEISSKIFSKNESGQPQKNPSNVPEIKPTPQAMSEEWPVKAQDVSKANGSNKEETDTRAIPVKTPDQSGTELPEDISVLHILKETTDPEKKLDRINRFIKSNYKIEIEKPYDYGDIIYYEFNKIFTFQVISVWWKSFDETIFIGINDKFIPKIPGNYIIETGKFENLKITSSPDGKRALIVFEKMTGTGTGYISKSRYFYPVIGDKILEPISFPFYEMIAGWGVFDPDSVIFEANEDVRFESDRLTITLKVTASATGDDGKNYMKKLSDIVFVSTLNDGMIQIKGPEFDSDMASTYGAFAKGDWFTPKDILNLKAPPKSKPKIPKYKFQ